MTSALAISSSILSLVVLAKLWSDALHFMYYRERMRIYRAVVGEGMHLVQTALDKGSLRDLRDGFIAARRA